MMANIVTNPTGPQSIQAYDLLADAGNTSQSLGSSSAPWLATLYSLTVQNNIATETLGTNIVFANQMSGSDLGAQINAADALLGSNPGAIVITGSGTVSTSPTISSGHDLIGIGRSVQVTLAGTTHITLNGNNRVAHLSFVSSNSSEVLGDLYANNVNDITIEDCSFSGGGWHIGLYTVTNFRISRTQHTSISALKSGAVNVEYSTYGKIDHVYVAGITLPQPMAGVKYSVAFIGLDATQYTDITDCQVINCDSSYVDGANSALGLSGCNYVNVIGGQYVGNANCDGVALQAGGAENATPCTYITITAVNSSYNGNLGLNSSSNYGTGDGFDLFNSAYVHLANCVAYENGQASGASGDTNRHNGCDIDGCSEVTITNCRFEISGLVGIDIYQSQQIKVIGSSVVGSWSQGIYVAANAGTCNTSGNSVTWESGAEPFGLGLQVNSDININGTNYKIQSVNSGTSITLTTNAGTHTGVSWYIASEYVQIIGGSVVNSGSGGVSNSQYGIDVEGHSTVWITGTDIGCTEASGTQSQIYGVYTAANGQVQITNSNFYNNGSAPINDNSGLITLITTSMTTPTLSLAHGSVGFCVNQGATSASTVLYVAYNNVWSAVSVP
jgi:hypothetical protein